MDQGIVVAEVGKKSGLFERFLADSGDVGILDGGINNFLGVVQGGELIETIVGNFGDAEMRLAGIGVGREFPPSPG